MASRLPKELWMAIIGDDFRVYNRLVRAVPGLSPLILTLVRALWSECIGMVDIMSGNNVYVIPSLNGKIHTTHPFVSFGLELYARYGILASNGDEPSIDQTQRNIRGQPTLRLTAYAQSGQLSRHNDPAFKYFDTEYGCEIYAVNGNVSRIRCIWITGGHNMVCNMVVRDAGITTISSRIAATDCVTNSEFNYEMFAQYASRIIYTIISRQDIDLIMRHVSKLTHLPIKHKHVSEICLLMRPWL